MNKDTVKLGAVDTKPTNSGAAGCACLPAGCALSPAALVVAAGELVLLEAAASEVEAAASWVFSDATCRSELSSRSLVFLCSVFRVSSCFLASSS